MQSQIIADHVTSIGLASEDEVRSFDSLRAAMLYSLGRSTEMPVLSEDEIERNVHNIKPIWQLIPSSNGNAVPELS